MASLLGRPVLCTDAAGIPRGPCADCKSCSSWLLCECSEVRFKQEGLRRDGGGGAAASVCECCGCPAERHRNLQDWLTKARRWVQCLVTKDGRWPAEVPTSFRLPAAAQDWEPAGAALHIVTNGQFDPLRDGRGATGHIEVGQLVSVVCPSIERYHPYHPLLYDCFRKQMHPDRELVVVDSGTTPSAYMEEKARQDPRVVYRFFFREEHGPEREEDPLERVRREDDPGEVIEWRYIPWTDAEKAEVRWEGFAMSMGLKRNIACYLARGSSIVHFNAGDLYAPGYISRMRRELLPSDGAAATPLAAVALAEWHGLDLPKESFRRLDFRKRDVMLAEDKKERIQLGRGFALAYTRTAWDKVPFLDDEEPEGRFMKTHQLLSHLRMVQPSKQDVLAAHSYDHASASGANAAASINISGEIKDFLEHSEAVPVPSGFLDLMPSVRKLSARANHKRQEEVARLLQLEGSAYFCEKCDAAVALKVYLLEVHRVGDPEGGSCMVAQFARAGGAIAEGEKVFEENRPLAPTPQLSSLSGNFLPLGGPRLLGIPTQKNLCPNWRAASSAMGGLAGQAPGLRSVLQPLAKASQEIAWFPGWFRRSALCRRCGCHIGRRYERREAGDMEETIFWALDLKYLREREAPPAPPPPVQDRQAKAKAKAKSKPAAGKATPAALQAQDRAPQKAPQERKAPQRPSAEAAPSAPKAPLKPQEEPSRGESRKMPLVLSSDLMPATAAAEAAAGQQPSLPVDAAAAAGAAKPAEQEVKPAAEESSKPPAKGPELPQEPMPPLSPAEKKARDAAEKARGAIKSLSPDLQEQLANGLAAADKSKFDSTLNAMKIDAETRRIILLELQVRPGMAASQLEQLVAKAFKTRVNMLRSLGLRVIRLVLEEVLPEEAREALRKAAAAGGDIGGSGAAGVPGAGPAAAAPAVEPPRPPEERPSGAQPRPPVDAAVRAAEAVRGQGVGFDFDALELLDPTEEG